MFESRISKELQRKIFELTLALYRVTDFFPQGEMLRRHLREKANEIFGTMTEYGYSAREMEQEATAVIARIQSVKGFLAVARSLRFVKPINLTVLEREYDYFERFFTQELEGIKNVSVSARVEEKPLAQDAVLQNPAEPQNPLMPEKKKDAESKADELPTWAEFASVEDMAEEKEDARPAIVEEGLSPISSDLNQRQKRIIEHLKGVEQAKVSDFYSVFSDISSKTIQRDLQDLVARNMLKKEGEKRWTIYSMRNVL